MTGLGAALSVELLKVRRSRVPLGTFVVFTILPLTGALFIFIVSDPDRARKLGLISAKAQLTGITPDWQGLLTFAVQIAAIGSTLVFSFVLTWLFGREFVDGTAHYLMALPVSRSASVTAKLAIYAVWGTILAIWLASTTLLIGWAMALPDASADVVVDGLSAMLRGCLLTLLTVTPIAWIASRTRGYLAPLATAMGLMVFAQVAAVLGWGAVVPWSIPAIAAGAAPDQHAGIGSLALVTATGALGCWATVRWWMGPDAGL